MLKFLPNISTLARRAAGFTMIELLIVITILGILAVAVLSAINPIEQINRGRDTSSQSDAEQMINAVERYNALQGFYPWVTSQNSSFELPAGGASLLQITSLWNDAGAPTACGVLEKLGSSTTVGCIGTNELKSSFTNRITQDSSRDVFIYNKGGTGDSTYVCFLPQSSAFKQQAKTRCGDNTGMGLPGDLDQVATIICATDAEYICLP